jgi:hypothetical protein
MTDLTQARLRALCCPPQHYTCVGERTGGNCVCETFADHLAAHDAVLEAAGIPIGKLVSGELVAVPKEPTEEMEMRGDEANPVIFEDPREEQSFAAAIWEAMLAARPKVRP